jgi:monovalent cation/proton antiporter MnhG/PhaG subunit
MNLRPLVTDILLGIVVLTCWVGTIGMWRMKQPIQALHYISLPASLGVIALSIAVFVEEGNSQASWKTLLIAVVVLGINAVVGHATGRAFRARELGHWEPLDGDPIESVRETEAK